MERRLVRHRLLSTCVLHNAPWHAWLCCDQRVVTCCPRWSALQPGGGCLLLEPETDVAFPLLLHDGALRPPLPCLRYESEGLRMETSRDCCPCVQAAKMAIGGVWPRAVSVSLTAVSASLLADSQRTAVSFGQFFHLSQKQSTHCSSDIYDSLDNCKNVSLAPMMAFQLAPTCLDAVLLGPL